MAATPAIAGHADLRPPAAHADPRRWPLMPNRASAEQGTLTDVRDDDEDTGARDWGWDFSAILKTVPGVQKLSDVGFTPVETVFGETEFATLWPEDQRRDVQDTRFAATGQEPRDEDELRLYLVRSPWPNVQLDEVVKLLFRWLHRNDARYMLDSSQPSLIDERAQLSVVAEFFRQSETWVRAYSKGRINRLAQVQNASR